MKDKPIIVIAGEPNSIFLEIFFKAIKKKKYKKTFILICCKKIFNKFIEKNNIIISINNLRSQNFKKNDIKKKMINLIDIECKKINRKFNRQQTNKYLVNCFDLALNMIKNGISNKLLNGPINKKYFLNKKFLGITEYISEKCKVKKSAMLIYNKKLSVCPATTHLPIKLIAKKITKKLIEEKIQLLNLFYKKKLNIRAKIGVTGLNPHCETILDFNEDDQIIKKAIISQKKLGIDVSGPLSADTIFLKKNRNKFNVILGMYHDQVLAPIKALFEFNAINVTIGLPFIRVTPDHGPNEIMAGKNKSDPLSIIQAINFLKNFD